MPAVPNNRFDLSRADLINGTEVVAFQDRFSGKKRLQEPVAGYRHVFIDYPITSTAGLVALATSQDQSYMCRLFPSPGSRALKAVVRLSRNPTYSYYTVDNVAPTTDIFLPPECDLYLLAEAESLTSVFVAAKLYYLEHFDYS